jgi:hypothetical protein
MKSESQVAHEMAVQALEEAEDSPIEELGIPAGNWILFHKLWFFSTKKT